MNTLRSKMGHVWSVMDPQVGIGAEIYPLKHKTCHFGPMLDPLMSGVGPLALILVLSGL